MLEDWADESLYWYGLYYRGVDPAGRRGAGSIFKGNPLVRSLLPWFIGQRARVQARGQGTGRKPAGHVAQDLARHLEHLETLLAGRAFLLDGGPMLCDCAVCGQLVYLQRTPHGAAAIDRHPEVGAYLARMKALRSG